MCKIEDEKSFMNNKMGLSQGSILGPLIFCLFINNLLCCCPDVELNADDTVIYTSDKSSAKVATILNEPENHLTLNVKKTLLIENKKKKERVHSEETEEVDEFKFLGFVLDSQLKFYIFFLNGKD